VEPLATGSWELTTRAGQSADGKWEDQRYQKVDAATAISALRVRYLDGRGILRDVIRETTDRGFAIDDISTEAVRDQRLPSGQAGPSGRSTVEVTLHVHGKNSVNDLAAVLSERDGSMPSWPATQTRSTNKTPVLTVAHVSGLASGG
jgi:hypothetical protein